MKPIILMLAAIALSVFATSPAAAQEPFDAFNQEFQARSRQSLGDQSVESWDKLSLYVSKEFLSRAVVTQINKSEISVSAIYPKQSLNPLPKPIILRFPRIDKSCPRPDCSWCGDCKWYRPHSCACREVCEAGADAVVAGCEALRSVYNLAALVKLGEVTFSDVQVGVTAQTSTVRLSLDDTLANAKIEAVVAAEVVVSARANVELTKIAFVFDPCPAGNITIPDTRVSVTAASFDVATEFTSEAAIDGILFKMKLKEAKADVRFSANPFFTLLANNPLLMFTCPPAAGVVVVAGSVDQIFPIVTSIDLPEKEVPVPVAAIHIKRPGHDGKALAAIKQGPLSLGIVAEEQQLAAAGATSNGVAGRER